MEVNIIIPAAGKSSRYNEGKPKWLRTHPNGKLMIEIAISGLVDKFEKVQVYLITTKEICDRFKVKEILGSLKLYDIKIIELKDQTHSSVETLLKAKDFINLESDFTIIKDSDNLVELEKYDLKNEYFTVGVDLNKFPVSRIQNKSFLVTNELGYVTDFVEKKIISETISVGTHGIKDIKLFYDYVSAIFEMNINAEKYVSNVISSMIYDGIEFKRIFATGYKDFGTQKEWNEEFILHSTYFIDFDGTLVKNKGKYGKNNWFNLSETPLEENLNLIRKLQCRGAEIIITTSRDDSLKNYIEEFLLKYKIKPKAILCNLNHSPRILINDFANTNPYPSCSAISFPRNEKLVKYFDYELYGLDM